MEKWKYLWSMCTSLHVLPVLLWFLNYSIMWNTCKVRETVFEYLWLLQPYRHAQTGILLKPQSFYPFLFLYIVQVFSHVWYTWCRFTSWIWCYVHTHTCKNVMRASKTEMLPLSSQWEAYKVLNYRLLT